MARTTTVVVESVDQRMPGLYGITLKFEYLDGATVLISRSFTQKYRHGQAPSTLVAAWKSEMQAAIDEYKAEETIKNAAALATAATNVNNGLVV